MIVNKDWIATRVDAGSTPAISIKNDCVLLSYCYFLELYFRTVS